MWRATNASEFRVMQKESNAFRAHTILIESIDCVNKLFLFFLTQLRAHLVVSIKATDAFIRNLNLIKIYLIHKRIVFN